MRLFMMTVMVMLMLAWAGCATTRGIFEVEQADNDHRYITTTRQRTQEDEYGRPMYHSCLEWSTAAKTQNNTKAALGGKGGNAVGQGEGSITFENAQSLGQIYAVGEIMQFAHESLFRLCEARSNYDITPEQYAPLFQDTLRTTSLLLCIQTQANKNSEIARLGGKVDTLTAQLEALMTEKKKQKEVAMKAREQADDLAQKSAAADKARVQSMFTELLDASRVEAPDEAPRTSLMDSLKAVADEQLKKKAEAAIIAAQKAQDLARKELETSEALKRAEQDKAELSKGDICSAMLIKVRDGKELGEYVLKTGSQLGIQAEQPSKLGQSKQ